MIQSTTVVTWLIACNLMKLQENVLVVINQSMVKNDVNIEAESERKVFFERY